MGVTEGVLYASAVGVLVGVTAGVLAGAAAVFVGAAEGVAWYPVCRAYFITAR